MQQQEARSFWSYVFSQRFAWHLVWLSVIQLWHYLFIGTLNNLLTKLAVGDRDLGIWRSWEAVSQHIPAGDLEPRGCGALSSAGLCAPEEGLSRGVGRRARVGGSSPVRQSWKSTTSPSLFSVVSSYTNAFAITQFFGVLCAPWNGLLMDRLKQKYQKEARRTGETWAPEHQGARRGEAFTYFHLHLFSF